MKRPAEYMVALIYCAAGVVTGLALGFCGVLVSERPFLFLAIQIPAAFVLIALLDWYWGQELPGFEISRDEE